MTTVAQVKRVVQPLLSRNSDLALVGRTVVLRPVHHLLRGIVIDRSIATNLFILTWAVTFLFEPKTFFSLNWGNRIGRPVPGALWKATDADVAEAMADEIERIALPRLRSLSTVEDAFAFAMEQRNFSHSALGRFPHVKILVDVARGDLQSASAGREYFLSDAAKRRYAGLMHEEYDRIVRTLCPLIEAGNRAGLVRLLHEYEAQTARALKLEKLWEPTPFPIEQRLA